MSADGTKQTAVGLQGQIYVSTDSGNTWAAKESNRDWYSVAMSADGTKQTAVGQNTQIYVSTDSGNTWTAKESNRYWWSVAMSADGTKQTAVVVGGQIYVSTDSGNTWTAKEFNRNWYSVTMSADGTKQTAVVAGGQIYVSMDSGNTWTAKESNRQWYSVAISADGTKQTAVVDQGQIYICSADMNYSYNVGIGTTNPQAKLDVRGRLNVEGNVGIGTTNPDPNVMLHVSGGGVRVSGGNVMIDHTTGSGLTMMQYNGRQSDITTWLNDLHITNFAGGQIRLNTDTTTASSRLRLLINNNGNVGIGTDNPISKLHVNGAIFGESSNSYGVYGVSDNTTGIYGKGSGSGKAGVYGFNSNGYGVHGESSSSYGVYGVSDNTTGIYGKGSGSGKAGVYGVNNDNDGYGVHGESTNGYAGYFGGDVFVTQDCSAQSFTDRTPYPKDLETAYEAVMSMERLPDGQYDENNKEVQLDHSMLSDFIRSKDDNRDLSATVSCHNEVLKDLIRKQEELSKAHTYIEQLQKQNQLLEARLVKLEAMITKKLLK